MRNNSGHRDVQEDIVLKRGDYIFQGPCGWSGPLRLIKNGLDIKGPLSFNLSVAAMARSNGVL